MNIKKYPTFSLLGLALILLALPISVFAQTVTSTQQGGKTQQLNTLNTDCQNEISQRLTSLNTIQARIPLLKLLSSTQQQQFLSQIATNISGLQGLQTQCTNDFNSGNLKNLINDHGLVFTKYRIYAEMLPQLNLLIASDTMGYTTSNLTTLYGKLQTRVQKAGNPNNLTTLLSDMNSKIADAQKQYNNVQSQIAGLTPSSYNSNPTGTTATFNTAANDIITAASDLQTAFSDANQIVQLLKSSKGSSSACTQSSTH